ncbi:MAG TPA: DUF1338 domain-containing protein, partial [Cyclobacteriaceae bacterium]|nr:DUF1338 domain-containing protein [Cyclobacteriaceae bacterium]
MSIEQFLQELWSSYTRITPSADAVTDLFRHWGEPIVNDHIAIRTVDDPRVDVKAISRSFVSRGYQLKENYHFPDRELRTVRLGHPHRPELPSIFISELSLGAFSTTLRQIVFNTFRDTRKGVFEAHDLILGGRVWSLPSYDIYETLLYESEYMAWIYVFGFCVNHFTVSVNALRKFGSLQQLNGFLQSNGFALHTSGGLIKGSPEQFLEQSGTLADRVKVHFREGDFMIPACNYQFALR